MPQTRHNSLRGKSMLSHQTIIFFLYYQYTHTHPLNFWYEETPTPLIMAEVSHRPLVWCSHFYWTSLLSILHMGFFFQIFFSVQLPLSHAKLNFPKSSCSNHSTANSSKNNWVAPPWNDWYLQQKKQLQNWSFFLKYVIAKVPHSHQSWKWH